MFDFFKPMSSFQTEEMNYQDLMADFHEGNIDREETQRQLGHFSNNSEHKRIKDAIKKTVIALSKKQN